MKFIIIIILIVLYFNIEHFGNDIFQFNYPYKYDNENCKYHYPEYKKSYSSLTDYEQNRINQCVEFKGFEKK
jgi:hypothetical protein